MSATGKAAQVADALLARADNLAVGSPALPIAMPDVGFDPATDATDGKYLEVDLLPNQPAWRGLNGGSIDQGLLQITVVWPKGEGLIPALQAAQEVKDHFPAALSLVSGSTRVKIQDDPTHTVLLDEPNETRIPVTIRWTA